MSTLNESIHKAVEVLQSGGIVALPSEGVYGLSCDPRQLSSIKNLYKIKERPENKGFILVAADIAQLEAYIRPLTPQNLALLQSTWPGPVTWIVPVNPLVSPLIHGNQETIAVRVTAHPILAQVCRTLGSAILSTSANKSAQPPALSARDIDALFSIPEINYILEGPLGNLNGPTEIRDLQSHAIIRPLT